MRQERFQLSFKSELAEPADRVWESAISPVGINRELSPLLRMTFPRSVLSLSPETITLGKPICRSLVLLFGLLPIDLSDVTILELGPGYRFLERSPVRTMRLWQHERTVVPASAGCAVTDRLTFEPRAAGSLVAWFLRRLFEHRHAVLRREFGTRG